MYIYIGEERERERKRVLQAGYSNLDRASCLKEREIFRIQNLEGVLGSICGTLMHYSTVLSSFQKCNKSLTSINKSSV